LSETSIEYVTGDSGIPPGFMPLALPTAVVVRDARVANERTNAFNRLLVIMVLVAWLANAKCKQIRPEEGVLSKIQTGDLALDMANYPNTDYSDHQSSIR
jgi:hypothetical protein